MLKVSVGLPRPSEGPEYADGEALAEIAATLEEAGLDGCHASDHPCPVVDSEGRPHHTLDPFVALGSLARATSRILLQTNALVLPYRNPLLTASMVATLDHLCRGRLTLGVGSGYLSTEARALGSDYAARYELAEEAIVTLRAAWSGQPVRLRGRHWMADGNSIAPVAVRGRLPIWLGGNSRRAMETAAKLCDGWMPTETRGSSAARLSTARISTIEELSDRIRAVRSRRAELGRTGPFDVCFNREAGWLSSPATVLRREFKMLAATGATWVAGRFDTASVGSRRELLDRIRALGDVVQGWRASGGG
jgi:probable F420-dependent oxidoreductase